MAINILLSNDDGYDARGLNILKSILKKQYNVYVVAPSSNQSATSHSLTLTEPLRINNIKKNEWVISGTPTDCVLIATHGLIKEKMDLVISGINHGPNMGEDVLYSGTIAAAMEGLMMGIPSIALSLATYGKMNFSLCKHFIPKLIKFVLNLKKRKILLNVNIPSIDKRECNGVLFTKLGTRVYSDILIEKTDPRGKKYYWIGGKEPTFKYENGTDFKALNNNYISITPLKTDLTNEKLLKELNKKDYSDVL